jgi:hypothetical protein
VAPGSLDEALARPSSGDDGQHRRDARHHPVITGNEAGLCMPFLLIAVSYANFVKPWIKHPASPIGDPEESGTTAG